MPEDFVDQEFLDLTPSPRLLEVIGDLDLTPWQCIAELVDNAFDEFRHDTDRLPGDVPLISITLPGASTRPEEAFVGVVDNGRGMDIDTLQRSLRAGYSGNERYGNLGLFGMGFNVATARLGNLTEVRTARPEDQEWLVVRIDLRALQRQEAFTVPVTREPKSDPGDHGTHVIVRQMRREIYDVLKRDEARRSIRETLGDVYSYLLRSPEQIPFAEGTIVGGTNIRLEVNSIRVKPRLPCVWAPERSVRVKGVEVPAVITIDETLRPAQACQQCGHWAHSEVDRCLECGSGDLQWRERRIKGWLGIQRYLHKSEFGVDFLRQGRKILRRDKSVFDWVDPDSDLSEPEYPIELPSGKGRIVGEIHLDHVAVSYRKHDFVRDSREWKRALNVIRGEAPLQPRKAKLAGLSPNESPLARLYAAYRRNDPGLRSLIPGDSAGNGPIHEKAYEWSEKFFRGDPKFQTDEVWYAAAVAYDRAAGALVEDASQILTDEAIRQVFVDAGLEGPTSSTVASSTSSNRGNGLEGDTRPSGETPPVLETDAERFARYRGHARKLLDMCGQVTLPFTGRMDVEVFVTAGVELARQRTPVPSLAWVPAGGRIEVFVDETHEVFRDFGRDPRDYALVEIATVIRARNNDDTPLTTLVAQVTRQFPDQKLTIAALRERVEDLLEEVRQRLMPVIEERPSEYWALLPVEDKERAERAAQLANSRLDWSAATLDGMFSAHLPATAIAILVRETPEDLLDGRVFTTRFSSWIDPDVRAAQVERLAGDLSSLGAFLAQGVSADRDQRMRIQLTERSLRAEIAQD